MAIYDSKKSGIYMSTENCFEIRTVTIIITICMKMLSKIYYEYNYIKLVQINMSIP